MINYQLFLYQECFVQKLEKNGKTTFLSACFLYLFIYTLNFKKLQIKQKLTYFFIFSHIFLKIGK